MNTKCFAAVSITALLMMGASCKSTETSNANTNASDTAYTTTAPDNSEVTTTNDNGVQTQTRTFRDNPRVSKVVVTTRNGTRTVKAYSPSGEEREMTSDSENALTAAGDAIANSAGWVKDKSITVADKTKEGAQTVGEKTKEGAEIVKDKTVDTAKTVGSKTKQGAKTVGEKTAEGAKKTGKAIKKVIPQ